MKKILAVSVLWFASWAAPPAVAYEACLGAKVTSCLEAIRPHLDALDYNLAQRNIEKYLAGDIAGVRKGKGVLSVAYHSKFTGQFDLPQMLVMDYVPTLEIRQIQITMRNGVTSAETEEEYQATHMYEAALFALGTQANCRELANSHDYYLFFHTKVRLQLKEKKQESVKGAFKPPSSFAGETGWIGICGSKMNYVVSSAEWGAVGADMDRRYGAFGASLIFK
jgi:hypothetical protein